MRRVGSVLDIALPLLWIAFTIVVIVGRDTGELAAYLFGVLAGVMAARLIVELAFRKGTIVARRPGVMVIDMRPFLRAIKKAEKATRDFRAAQKAAGVETSVDELRSLSSRLHEAAKLESEGAVHYPDESLSSYREPEDGEKS